jgi:hypothetical protein
MKHYRAFACAALWLACAAPTEAGDHDYAVVFPAKNVSLGVQGGQPRALDLPGQSFDWVARPKAKETQMEVLSPERWRGRYLAYDPDAKGKDKGAVFLAAKSGPGTKWLVERVKGSKYTVRAASGKLKGWYLDVAEKGQEATDGRGRRSAVYKVFLSEKPKKAPQWDFGQIGS